MKITNFIPKTLTGFLVVVGAAVLSGCTPTPAPALVQHSVYAVVYGVVLFVLFNFIEQMVNKYNNLLWADGGLTVIDKVAEKRQKTKFQKGESPASELVISAYPPCVIGHKPVVPKQSKS
jgi:hypothetical protein